MQASCMQASCMQASCLQVRLTHDNQMSRRTDIRSIQIGNASEVCGVDSCCCLDSYIKVVYMILILGVCSYFSECEALIFIRRLTMRVHNGAIDVPPCVVSPRSAEEVCNSVQWHCLVGWTRQDFCVGAR